MSVTNYYSTNGQIIGEKTTGGSRIDYLTDALGSVPAPIVRLIMVWLATIAGKSADHAGVKILGIS
jgi:hypothetical protein